jgi:WD40 repeat protein
VSGGADRTLRVWDIDKGVCLQKLEGHNSWVKAVAVINAQKVVSGSDDRTLRIWDIDSGECLQELKGHNGSVNAVAVINEQKVVSGSNDKALRVWDIDKGVCLQVFEGHENEINAVAVINEHTIVSGSEDRMLRIWDLNMSSLTAKQMIVLCTIATKVVNNQPMQESNALRLKKEVQELFSDEKADEKRYKDKMLEYLDKRIDLECRIRNLYK